MSSQILHPYLLIYLRASISTLVAHIESRGRDYEGNMSLDYLKRLNEKYENWIQNYTHGDLLIVPIDDLDFIKSSEDLGTVIQSVQSKLYGLF